MSITVQQDATLYSFYSLQTARHVLGDVFTHHQERLQTVFTASSIDRTVCCLPLIPERQRKVLILRRQRKVTYGSINARCCKHSLLPLLMMDEDITQNM
jgi:hypothetical protein